MNIQLLEDGPSLVKVLDLRDGHENEYWMPKDKYEKLLKEQPPEEKKPRESSRKTYVQKLLDKRRPKELVNTASENFISFAKFLSTDTNLLVAFSASDSLTSGFRNDYELRSGVPLIESCNVDDETLGIKLNIVCSKEIATANLPGITFKPFFNSDQLVLVYGDRAGAWWGLIDLGFRIGLHKDQDINRINSLLEACP